MSLRLLVLAGWIAASTTMPALAEGLELGVPYGNKSGCANRDGQAVYAEDMLLLTDVGLVTATSACTFTQWTIGGGGMLTLKAECEIEGEEGRTSVKFTLNPDPNDSEELTITDETGFVMGKVAQCK